MNQDVEKIRNFLQKKGVSEKMISVRSVCEQGLRYMRTVSDIADMQEKQLRDIKVAGKEMIAALGRRQKMVKALFFSLIGTIILLIAAGLLLLGVI